MQPQTVSKLIGVAILIFILVIAGANSSYVVDEDEDGDTDEFGDSLWLHKFDR